MTKTVADRLFPAHDRARMTEPRCEAVLAAYLLKATHGDPSTMARYAHEVCQIAIKMNNVQLRHAEGLLYTTEDVEHLHDVAIHRIQTVLDDIGLRKPYTIKVEGLTVWLVHPQEREARFGFPAGPGEFLLNANGVRR